MWLHYSDRPLAKADLRAAPKEAPSGPPNPLRRSFAFEKPTGFWITDDSDWSWKAWCLGERFRLNRLTHKHEIVLDASNLLRISTKEGIDWFSHLYAGPAQGDGFTGPGVDWGRVARDFSGLVIAPYIAERRFTPGVRGGVDWYYGWDCASGCIWDISAIEDVRLIEVTPLAELRGPDDDDDAPLGQANERQPPEFSGEASDESSDESSDHGRAP